MKAKFNYYTTVIHFMAFLNTIFAYSQVNFCDNNCGDFGVTFETFSPTSHNFKIRQNFSTPIQYGFFYQSQDCKWHLKWKMWGSNKFIVDFKNSVYGDISEDFANANGKYIIAWISHDDYNSQDGFESFQAIDENYINQRYGCESTSYMFLVAEDKKSGIVILNHSMKNPKLGDLMLEKYREFVLEIAKENPKYGLSINSSDWLVWIEYSCRHYIEKQVKGIKLGMNDPNIRACGGEPFKTKEQADKYRNLLKKYKNDYGYLERVWEADFVFSK